MSTPSILTKTTSNLAAVLVGRRAWTWQLQRGLLGAAPARATAKQPAHRTPVLSKAHSKAFSRLGTDLTLKMLSYSKQGLSNTDVLCSLVSEGVSLSLHQVFECALVERWNGSQPD